MKSRYLGGLAATVLAASALAVAPAGAGAPPSQAPAAQSSNKDARALARSTSQHLIASRAPQLRIGAGDAFVAKPVVSSSGVQYAAYERTYRGLPVVGGDFVVVTDKGGHVLSTSVAQSRRTSLASVTPKVSKATAASLSRRQLGHVDKTGASRLVVWQKAGSHLAWETRVSGRSAGEPSIKSVYVDARSGKVLGAREHVMEGTGSSAYSGSVSIPTTLSGSTYSMKNPSATTMACQDAATNTTFSGTDDAWGNGAATNRETGCVDAYFAAEKERQMLSAWLGRSGMNGSGGWVPIRVGLADVNAYYDGTQVQIGHSQTGGRWIGSIDVVAHEFGHGIDDTTPGGISGNGTQEFVADTFGAMTEWYANEAAPNDTPDYTVGEEVDLVGAGPIRYMYNPSLAGDANCYSSATPTSEVHSAAGPGNHWFYLLAEGTSPTNGQPASPTCNSTTSTGLGIQKAAKIMYNAMLMKTSTSSYLKYRTWTLTAAKNLYPGSCTEFNAVKAAWTAVSVPAQTADPTCSTAVGSQLLLNPGFESGAVNWTGSAGPITTDTGRPARTGTWKMWLGGNGVTTTENEAQTVTIPATATSATLTFWIRIDSAETSTTSAFDTAKIQIVNGATTTTLATYSNLDKGTTYVQKSFNVTAYKGSAISVKFLSSEDSSLQTSFVVDDTALNVG